MRGTAAGRARRTSATPARRGTATGAALLCVAALTGGAPAAPAAAAVAPVGQGFTVTASDLSYILKQIKVAERHAATATASDPCGTLLGPGKDQVPDPLTPYGLRTVDGSCNNLTAGGATFAAADQPFPRLTDPVFRAADPITPDFPVGPPGPTSYAPASTTVVDAQPRVISNLIDDQTESNPAAVAAAGPSPVKQGRTLFVPNVSTDAGLTPPYNSLFTFFGQFFDHGLDQTVKSGGTVFVPLRPDDPLVTVGPDGIAGTGDEVPMSQAFMVLTRARQTGGAHNQPSAPNTDSPWVDQSQTYASHASHQVFLREYRLVGGRPVATGKLLGGLPAEQTYPGSPDGTTGMSTWASLKKQAADELGLRLVDADVTNVPMLATDPYGEFLPGPHGLPQYVTTGHGLVEGDLADPVPVPSDAVHFDTPFVGDIAHNADPSPDPQTHAVPVADGDTTVQTDFTKQPKGTYDDELLASHFTCGDGRCNENIALSAIHQVFHSEHNRLVDDIQNTLDQPGNAALLAAYQDTSATTFGYGDRLFQAARFVNEMEYQHLVFEEFARKVQPNIPVFHSYQPSQDPAISMEFAQAVYRFGHSMLDETVARTDQDGSDNSVPLLTAFLDPPEYFHDKNASTPYTPEQAAGAVIMGSSDQTGNEIDEFVTETLRNNLLGLPLDLPALNIARARETGIPPLNVVRRQIAAANADSGITPYTSWSDFGNHLKHPESLVNFVAAYGQHPTIVGATTLAAKRAAARALVAPTGGDVPPTDAADFMNSTGTTWAPDAGGTQTTGLDDVDLWVGGLAEAYAPFGGMLGSTFGYVFETQLTALQDDDRFYYVSRTSGMNLLSQLEGNSFAELIQRNTDGTHTLKADAFGTADCKFELAHLAGTAAGYATYGPSVADDPTTACDESKLLERQPDGRIDYLARNSVDRPGINGQSVYNGTAGVDRVLGGNDNDTLWGNGGNDRLDGGMGNDVTLGGDGNDLITDADGVDVLKGGPGNDSVQGGPGADLVLGGDGADLLDGGLQDNEAFGGPGNDLIIAGQGADTAQGDGGDDFIEGGLGKDVLIGDHNAPFLDDPGQTAPGNDVFVGQSGDNTYLAEGGDDVMTASDGIDTFGGGGGFDWSTHQFDTGGAVVDMKVNAVVGPVKPSVPNVDAWQETEAVSGSDFNDVIRGDDSVPRTTSGGGFTGCDALDAAGVARIGGLSALLPADQLTHPAADVAAASLPGTCPLTGGVWGEGNILLGGPGSDTIEGRGGNDIIDGDRSLQLRLHVRGATGVTDLLENGPLESKTDFGPGTDKMTLEGAIAAGLVDPGDVYVTRELVSPPAADWGSVDTAVFSDYQANYTITPGPNGSTIVAHKGGGGDGTDTLFNIEKLVFKPAPAPSAPQIGSAVAGDSAATVSWSAPPEPVTGFDVATLDAAGNPAGPTVTVGGDLRSVTVVGLTDGTTYRFRVRGTNAAGTGAWSGSSAAVTPASVSTGPPSTVVPPVGQVIVTPGAVGTAQRPALVSALSASSVCLRCGAVLTGAVEPFRGVTVELARQTVDGAFAPVARTTIAADSSSGRYAFALPTTASGRTTYRVTVSGPDLATTAGPALTLSVFRVAVSDVRPDGAESVALRNVGRVAVQLAGWRLVDPSGRRLVLPAYVLAPGATVRVFTGGAAAGSRHVALHRDVDLWRAGHGRVRVRDGHGGLVASRRY